MFYIEMIDFRTHTKVLKFKPFDFRTSENRTDAIRSPFKDMCSIFEHFCEKKCSKLDHVLKLFLRVIFKKKSFFFIFFVS